MSEKATNNKNVRNDEIDLLDLFRRMGKTLKGWINSLARAILISLVFLLKRWLPVGLSIIVGLGISITLKLNSESFYTSDLTFKNNLALMDAVKLTDYSGTTAELISHINKLHTFCKEDNKKALSEILSLKPEYINNLVDISAFWIIDKNKDGIPDFVDYRNNHDIYDTIDIRMQDRVDIRVKIKSPQELTLLRDGIIKLIDNDSLFQQRNRLRLQQNLEMSQRLNYDIFQLDSLQKIKYFVETKYNKPQTGGQMIFLQEQKTQLIYSDIYTLYERKQRLESQRVLFNGIITILSDFALPAKRDNGVFYYANKSIPLCFGFVLLILIILANRKKLKDIYNKYEN